MGIFGLLSRAPSKIELSSVTTDIGSVVCIPWQAVCPEIEELPLSYG
ncbi:rCG59888 [Rattus norvegicus]|uniref:RCG59888 n=1 Tax=Rattus norvegicus TaxID=10116 RepID=A6HRN9_RAT|nr:rCG59888 [Rattus norvegicus]